MAANLANGTEGLHGFLLSSSLTDLPGTGRRRTGLVFQGRLSDGRRFRWEVTRPRLCFFVDRGAAEPPAPHARKPLELRTLRGHPVDALYFESAPDLARARRHYQGSGLPTYEADIPATARHLMERGIRGGVRFLDEPVPESSERGGILRFVDPRVAPSDWTPSLRLLSLDVECAPGEGLFSISLYGEEGGLPWTRVFVRDPARPAGSEANGYTAHPDEASLLRAFLAAVREFDPDALIGWNVINFDLRYLARRCARAGLALDLGTDGPAELIEPEGAGRSGPQWLARIPGRCALDGIAMLRAAFVEAEEGYSLAAVSRQVLGERKLIELEGEEKMAEITRRFREDKPALARYNLEDSRLAHAIFMKLGLAALAVRKASLTGLAVDRMGGSMAAFDFLYLPRLHRKGFVADTESAHAGEAVPGGLVLEGVPGFFRNVVVLDFKSLYPSIIRTFRVDPLAAAAAELGLPAAETGLRAGGDGAVGAGPAGEGPAGASPGTGDAGAGPREGRAGAGEAGDNRLGGGRILVRGPAGPAFAADMAILPGIVESLAEARERAKREKDASLSQAVKIIMNSFYGVLGNPTCRFHRPDLAGAITLSGQWILLASRDFLERSGHRVIYGDTDSLFVHAGEEADPASLPRLGAELAERLNRHLEETLRAKYGVESRLTMQSDKVFTRFFLPALRREDRGSKKRYAGLLAAAPGAEPELHFAGMESARSDWTRLAKDFQADLLRAVFSAPGSAAGMAAAGPPGGVAGALPAVEARVRDWNRRLFAGELDHALEYRKALSKAPEEYGASAPPHVRAARILDRRDGRTIRYVMTVEGPEPVQKRSGARPDYRHYAEKQLAPIADMVLRFLGTDFETLTAESSQLKML